MAKTYLSRITVRAYELDSFGHVNNSVYLNYLEHARWQMLGEVGITLSGITRQQLWPVIMAIEIKYLKPAFMGEELEIRTRIAEHGKARFTCEQDIFRGDTRIASARVESVIVDADGRPVRVPGDYNALWSE